MTLLCCTILTAVFLAPSNRNFARPCCIVDWHEPRGYSKRNANSDDCLETIHSLYLKRGTIRDEKCESESGMQRLHGFSCSPETKICACSLKLTTLLTDGKLANAMLVLNADAGVAPFSQVRKFALMKIKII